MAGQDSDPARGSQSFPGWWGLVKCSRISTEGVRRDGTKSGNVEKDRERNDGRSRPRSLPLHRRVREVRRLLQLQLADTLNAWELKPDGSFAWLHPKESEEPLDSHAILLEEGF